MRQGEVVLIVLILLCAALTTSTAISDQSLSLASGGGQTIPKRIEVPLNLANVSSSLALDEQSSGSDARHAGRPVYTSHNEKISILHLPVIQSFDTRIWGVNTRDIDARAQAVLLNSSEVLRDALLFSGPKEADTTNTISPTPSTGTSNPILTFLSQKQTFGAESNPTGNPIGGGDGYTDIISRDDPRVKFIVDTRDELLSALQSARSGDVIYVEGNANIDMSGYVDIYVPAGVTIASNRGENGAAGGRIYQNRDGGDWEYDWAPLFRTAGQNARFTGLRIEGPDKTTSAPRARCAIHATYPLEVDNCEIAGWSFTGIGIYRTGSVSDMKNGGYFHHNHIHHCQMNGLGYGIGVNDGAVCLIEANYLEYCRHAIAGDGNVGTGYEARYNIFGPNFIANYAFQVDMHGKPNPSGPGTIAGDTIRIHHNTFMATGHPAADQMGPLGINPIRIRGVPRVGAYVDHNWFYYTLAPPVWQTDDYDATPGDKRLSVTANLIGQDRVLSPSGPIKYY